MNGSCEPPITIRDIVEGLQLKLKDFRNLVSFVAWIEANPIMIELALAQDVMSLSSP